MRLTEYEIMLSVSPSCSFAWYLPSCKDTYFTSQIIIHEWFILFAHCDRCHFAKHVLMPLDVSSQRCLEMLSTGTCPPLLGAWIKHRNQTSDLKTVLQIYTFVEVFFPLNWINSIETKAFSKPVQKATRALSNSTAPLRFPADHKRKCVTS